MARSMEKAVNSTETTPQNTLRYERKFIYTYALPEDIINAEVLSNSFCFREIYHRRTVNNCYFDDQNSSFYHQNVAGDTLRKKYRLRWYGDHFERINSPTLEIKRKNGVVGDKLSFKLNTLDLDLSDTTGEELFMAVQAGVQKEELSQELSLHLNHLSPSLYNSYERRYFLSACQRFRITIDYNMKFYDPNIGPLIGTGHQLRDVILELKYAVQDDADCRNLTQEFRARLSKNSKYVRGLDAIKFHPHF